MTAVETLLSKKAMVFDRNGCSIVHNDSQDLVIRMVTAHSVYIEVENGWKCIDHRTHLHRVGKILDRTQAMQYRLAGTDEGRFVSA